MFNELVAEDLPRLLAGIDDRPMARLHQHLDVHGLLPRLDRHAPETLIGLIDRAGLRGYGGAAFPVAAKMRAVTARRRRPVVVANGSEGEPASKKDAVLLRELPHLVLDGAAVAARAVGADSAIVAVSTEDERSLHSLDEALRERRNMGVSDPHVEVFTVEPRYVAGQATALVNALNGGPSIPTLSPPHVAERGVGRRPTLVQNVETLAHLALIARHGPEWYRAVGTPEDPGSALVTLSGAVAAPGVYEIAHGMSLAELLDGAVPNEPLRAVLIGGYFGSWLSMGDAEHMRLCREGLTAAGASLGAGVIVALGQSACPVAETLRIADFFATESAGQCGPCVYGLQAIADTLYRVAAGTADRDAEADLHRWAGQLPGRGACSHPDGAARFIASSIRMFAHELRDHARRGPCARCTPAPQPEPTAAAPPVWR